MKIAIKCLSGLVIIAFMAFVLNVVMAEAAGLSSVFNSSSEQKNGYSDEEKKQAIKDAISDDNISGEEEEKLLDMYGGDMSALIKNMLPELILNYTGDGNLDDKEIGRLESLVELAKGDNEMLADALVTAFPSLNKDDIMTTFKNKPDKVKENVRELARAATNKKIEDKPKPASNDKGGITGIFSKPAESSVPATSVTQTNSRGYRCIECGIDLRTGTHPGWCKRGAGVVSGNNNTTSQGTKDAFKPQGNDSTSTARVDPYNGQMLCGNKSMHDARIAMIGYCLSCDKKLRDKAAGANNAAGNASNKLPDAKPYDNQCDYCGAIFCSAGQKIQDEICPSCSNKGVSSGGGSSTSTGGSTSGGGCPVFGGNK